MLSKRANFNIFSQKIELPNKEKYLRMEEEISFIPSIKRDTVKTISIFLRETNQKDHQFQITICLNDYSLGRLGYYDLSYNKEDIAKKQFEEIIEALKKAREHIEYNMLPSGQMESICKKSIDAVLDKAGVFDSTYGIRSLKV